MINANCNLSQITPTVLHIGNYQHGNNTWFVVAPTCLKGRSFYVLSKLPHEQGFFMATERRIEQKSTAQYPDGHFVSPYQDFALATENSTSFMLRIAICIWDP